jgi:tetrahydromethanopterin S-methyltransferase subunit B
MSMIRIAPELHLVLDPDTATVAEERADSIEYSMDPVLRESTNWIQLQTT